jgi:hypothetical protein
MCEACGRQFNLLSGVDRKLNDPPLSRSDRRIGPGRLFKLWATIGFVWVMASFICVLKCPDFNPIRRTFRFVAPTAKDQALYEEVDRWETRLTFLRDGALVHGVLGVVLFFRRGRIVFVIAAAVVLLCEFALLELTWVAP